METVENIKKRLSDIEIACAKVVEDYWRKCDEGIPFDVAWKWYTSQPVIKERERLENELRCVKEPEYFEPIVKYNDDVYTLKEFIEMCKSGGFVDSDGFGVYAFEDKKSDIKIYPSDIRGGKIRNDFTHIVWYNK